MRSFTSYVSDYDAHRGTRSLNQISRDQQNELIRLMLDREADFGPFVMNNDLEHLQPDGLWSILVSLGCLLERRRVIAEFPPASTTDRDWVINMLAGTVLGLRLEEAFDPFDRVVPLTEYDWREVERFGAKDAIADMADDEIATRLKALLRSAPVSRDGIERRLPFQDFVKRWEEGKLTFFVDRGLAVQAYRLSDSALTYLLPFTFFAGLLAFIPVMIFVGFWWGLGVLALAIASRKFLTKAADTWVRKEALEKRERYRWFSARGIIWAQVRP